MAKNKKTIIPPSLKPRKTTKKIIPGSKPTPKKVVKTEKVKAAKKVTPKPAASPVVEKVTSSPTPPPAKAGKKRFTLWMQEETFRAFKVHVAMNGGRGSDYIESLIKKDLNL